MLATEESILSDLGGGGGGGGGTWVCTYVRGEN